VVSRVNPVSFKAMRSIILKKIQNRLARSNNDPMMIVKEGLMGKKSSSKNMWITRYFMMDGKDLRYYMDAS